MSEELTAVHDLITAIHKAEIWWYNNCSPLDPPIVITISSDFQHQLWEDMGNRMKGAAPVSHGDTFNGYQVRVAPVDDHGYRLSFEPVEINNA